MEARDVVAGLVGEKVQIWAANRGIVIVKGTFAAIKEDVVYLKDAKEYGLSMVHKQMIVRLNLGDTIRCITSDDRG